MAATDSASSTHNAESIRETIRGALIAGEASGEPRPFDPEAFKQRMKDAWAEPLPSRPANGSAPRTPPPNLC